MFRKQTALFDQGSKGINDLQVFQHVNTKVHIMLSYLVSKSRVVISIQLGDAAMQAEKQVTLIDGTVLEGLI